MKRYIAQTTIALLQALILIFMAPAFVVVFVVIAAYSACRTSYDWLSLHGVYGGDKTAQDRAKWRAS